MYEFYQLLESCKEGLCGSDLAFMIAIAPYHFFAQATPPKPDRHGKPARRGTSRGLEVRAGLEHE